MRRLNRFLQPLWLALGLLTTLPMGRLIATPVSATNSGRSVLCYPVVGLLLGTALAVLAALLHEVHAVLGAGLVVTAWVVLTGALHLDGLGDCVDAFFAGHGRADPARTLAVMKDPAAGPMAVVALILLLLLKCAALIALWPRVGPVLLVVPLVARAAATLLMATTRYRRREGLASALALNLSRSDAGVIVAIASVFSLLFAGLTIGLVTLATALAVGVAWRWLWVKRIGGYTGDVVGGLIELIETTTLIATALWLSTWG